MKELFQSLLRAIGGGDDAVLVSIIASSGSTPRGDGAKMAVFPGGRAVGTIGGGAVEHLSIQMALEVLAKRSSRTHGFNLAPNQTADIGMICGGSVVVYFQYFAGNDPEAIALFSRALALLGRNGDAWLITLVQEGSARTGLYDPEGGVQFVDVERSTLEPMLGANSVLQKGEPTYYVEPLCRAGLVYVFGGGHVSKELVPVISHVGFRPVVFEDRPEFARRELFPGAVDTILGDFKHIGEKVRLCEKDAAVIMTRGHQADYEVLEQVLRTPAGYIGLIGSRHKIAATRERLRQAGFPDGAFDRVHTPIGLSIRAETPEEIAISIAAQMILYRAQTK